MCGIAGVLDFKGNNIEPSVLKAMCGAMVHRGPDDEGIYISPQSTVSITPQIKVGLGHRRLSIIDLSPAGHQPMSNEDGTIWLVMNGEIYNFLELREELEQKGHRFKSRTDAEVILHLYEEKGIGCIADLRGMFALAVWNEKKKQLVLTRDRIGKKPLLYAILDDKLIFASEFNAMLKHPDVSKEMDFEALHHYLTYLFIPPPATIFRRIKKLPAASILVWERNRISLENYWQLDFAHKIKISEEEAVELLEGHLKEALGIRLISDVPLGVLLSGGIDSTCITAFTSELKKGEVRTFSIGFAEAGFNELPYAKTVASIFKTEHHYDYVTPDVLGVLPELVERYGEPYADSSALPTYYVSKAAAKNVRVVLNGDGGDELFAGYRRHLANYLAERWAPAAKMINKSPLRLFFNLFPDRPSGPNSLGNARRFLDAAQMNRPSRYMRWTGFFTEELKRDIYTDEFKGSVRSADSNIFMRDLFEKAEGLDSIDAALYVDTMLGLQSDLLVKMDIASMANSLETRSPFLDHRLMEFAASLPSSFKIRRFSLKFLLKRLLKGRVPEHILRRPKKGFSVPVDRWFRGPLKDYLVGTILSKRALDRGYFEPRKLRRFVEAHLSGRNCYGQHLWGLLILELWHRRFID